MTNPDPFLRRALRLAASGLGRTSPNPMVGAVLVRDGQVVGEGAHLYERRWHAERVALDQAGPAARGADLYVTLEPCSHQGRTPPCAEAIVAAGIRRVICGMVDPNPLVSGRGIAQLRAAGIPVELAADPEPFRELNRAFVKYITRRRPWVILKAALTLDGRIAPASGRSQWITGVRARGFGQFLRFQADAILVGRATVAADDPLLTCRYRISRPRPLLRVVLDPDLRLPPDCRLVRTATETPVQVWAHPGAAPDRCRRFEAAGVRVVEEAVRPDGRFDLDGILARLAEQGVMSLLVEGGGRTLTEFVRQGQADEFCFFYGPTLLGGDALPVLGDLGRLELAASPRLRIRRTRRLGPDLLVQGYFQSGPGRGGTK